MTPRGGWRRGGWGWGGCFRWEHLSRDESSTQGAPNSKFQINVGIGKHKAHLIILKIIFQFFFFWDLLSHS
jgi:hypothetical protein